MAENGKVIVLGGGVAGVTASLELARSGVDVEIIQMGWRLGGKGASGRNIPLRSRIEEHGFHVWFGFYRNAFRSLAKCFEEIQQVEIDISESTQSVRIVSETDSATSGVAYGTPLGRVDNQPLRMAFGETLLKSIDDGFVGSSLIGVMEEHEGWYEPWMVNFPLHRGTPWEAGSGDRGPTEAFDFVRTGLRFARRYLESIGIDDRSAPAIERWLSVRDEDRLHPGIVNQLVGDASRLVDGSAPSSLWLFVAHEVVESISTDLFGQDTALQTLLSRLLGGAHASLARHVEEVIASDDGPNRRAWQLVDILSAVARGLVADGVASGRTELEDLDEEDFRVWLARHGASQLAVESPVIRACAYDLVFGYRKGDRAQPVMGAGSAIRGLGSLFFGFDGHIMYKMRAAMGDVVFVPEYLALDHHDGTVTFFTRVERLGFDGLSFKAQASTFEPHLNWILLSRQAAEPFENPLIAVELDRGHVLSWPSRPLRDRASAYSKLENLLADEELKWAYETSRGSLSSTVLVAVADRLERLLIRSGLDMPWSLGGPGSNDAEESSLWPPCDRSSDESTSWSEGIETLLTTSGRLARNLDLELRILTDGADSALDPLSEFDDTGSPIGFRETLTQILLRSKGVDEVEVRLHPDRKLRKEFDEEVDSACKITAGRLEARLAAARAGQEQFPSAYAPSGLIRRVRQHLVMCCSQDFEQWGAYFPGHKAPIFWLRHDENAPKLASNRLRGITAVVSNHLEELFKAQDRVRSQAVALSKEIEQPLPPWNWRTIAEELISEHIGDGLDEIIESWFRKAESSRIEGETKSLQPGWQRLVTALYGAVHMPEFVSVVCREDGKEQISFEEEHLIFAVRKARGPFGLLQMLGVYRGSVEDLEQVSTAGQAATFLKVNVTIKTDAGAAVVNAMPISTMPLVAEDVMHVVPTWAASARHVETVGTQAAQIWHGRDGAGLGWERVATEAVHHRPVNDESSGPTLGGFVEPFDTWSDLSVTREFEVDDESCPVGAISYFCSALPEIQSDHFLGPWDGPLRVLQNTLNFLDDDVKEIWPAAGYRYPSAFDWDKEFVHPHEVIDWPPDLRRLLNLQVAQSQDDPVIFARKERVWKLRSQEQFRALRSRLFVSANGDPSNAYTLNVPGSTRFRIWPGDTGVGNVTFAGDWTKTILNAGCVEAAVVSGMLAAESALLQLGLEDKAFLVRDSIDGMEGRSWPTARSRL